MAKTPQSTPLALQPPKSFEEAVAELEQLVSQMEQGQQPLEQSIEQYERGNYLLKWCKGVLGEAEKKIERISRGEPAAQGNAGGVAGEV